MLAAPRTARSTRSPRSRSTRSSGLAAGDRAVAIDSDTRPTMLQTSTAPRAAALGLLIAAPLASVLAGGAAAQDRVGDPISQAIADSDEQVREYNMHLTFLAHPFLEGRLPGTRGMEIAKDYVEEHFIDAGLAPPFVDADGNPSYRQDFSISERVDLTNQYLTIGGRQLAKNTDFRALSLGSGGLFAGEAVFVGYSIENGRDGYSSYADEDDLDGKIAIMLRFEPMAENGWSRWRDGERWSARAGFRRKVADAVERGADGVIIINTPGVADERITEDLPPFTSGGRTAVDVPVMTMSTDAGEKLIAACGPEGVTLTDLRERADEGRCVVPLTGRFEMLVQTSTRELVGQNICGLVPGKGALANEIICIGAHLDHLGMGEFGSRYRGPRAIHPGADDNASGSAAMIMLAERFTEYYASLPEGASARTILIQCYDAEEQGLIGAYHYTRDPIRPIEDHALMLNFDMIGRITDEGGMSVTGLGSGVGLRDFVEPFLADCPLKLVPGDGVMAASDHWAFHQAGVPTLMGICDPLHADYHTPRDTADRINRVNAVHAMNLWGDICLAAALHDARFEHVNSPGASRRPRQEESQDEAEPAPAADENDEGPRSANVRLGVVPGNYDEEGNGVLASRVVVDSPAAKAGLVDGDRILSWDGEKLENVRAMSEKLRLHEAGDEVKLEVERDGETMELTVTLEAKG